MFSFEIEVIRSSVEVLVALDSCLLIDFLVLVEDNKLLFLESSAWGD